MELGPEEFLFRTLAAVVTHAGGALRPGTMLPLYTGTRCAGGSLLARAVLELGSGLGLLKLLVLVGGGTRRGACLAVILITFGSAGAESAISSRQQGLQAAGAAKQDWESRRALQHGQRQSRTCLYFTKRPRRAAIYTKRPEPLCSAQFARRGVSRRHSKTQAECCCAAFCSRWDRR